MDTASSYTRLVSVCDGPRADNGVVAARKERTLIQPGERRNIGRWMCTSNGNPLELIRHIPDDDVGIKGSTGREGVSCLSE